MHKQLPLNQTELENFVLHHMHLRTKEVRSDERGPLFTEEMEAQLKGFVYALFDKFEEVAKQFEDAA